MRVKGKRILKNGAVAGYIYYSDEKKWKWRIFKGPKKGMKGGENNAINLAKKHGFELVHPNTPLLTVQGWIKNGYPWALNNTKKQIIKNGEYYVINKKNNNTVNNNNTINNNGVNNYYTKNKRLSGQPDNIIYKYKININGNEYRIGLFSFGYEIKEEFRGRGIGTEIMNKILKDYDFFLIKNIKDDKARKFWNKFNKLSIDEGLGKKMLDLINEKRRITGAAFFINNWKWNENYDSGKNTKRNLEPFNFSNN